MIMPSKHPDELLAWYVNGTLTDPERNDVRQHLETCVRCQREISLLEEVRKQLKTDEPEAPGELGLHRLLRDIHRPKPSAVPERRRWLPALAAAAAMIIVVQGVVLLNLLYQPAPITPLGESPLEQAVLQVKFAPNATEQEIRHVLQKVGATLIGGPGAVGVYRIRLETANPPDEAVQKTISELRAHGNIVTYVARE